MKLLRIYDLLAQELEEIREMFDKELVCDVACAADMLEQVGKFRGKMLRPILVLLCGKACGSINHTHRVIATVMEMIHMATLVHDDVLDEAEYRRRGRTINALHSNEAAVLLGDMLISHAFHLCSSLETPLAARLIASTTNTVCEGELMQLYYCGYHELSEERYLDIITRKTGCLIATCCYLGAQNAGADENICRDLELFGRDIGVAFQIIDDISDLVGDERIAGKTLGSDIAMQKITLPGIHYLAHCRTEQGQWVRQVLTQQRRELFDQYVERLGQTGSIAYARQRAAEFIEQAKNHLPQQLHAETSDILRRLADSIIDENSKKRTSTS